MMPNRQKGPLQIICRGFCFAVFAFFSNYINFYLTNNVKGDIIDCQFKEVQNAKFVLFRSLLSRSVCPLFRYRSPALLGNCQET
jgi:hypothetical protein